MYVSKGAAAPNCHRAALDWELLVEGCLGVGFGGFMWRGGSGGWSGGGGVGLGGVGWGGVM